MAEPLAGDARALAEAAGRKAIEERPRSEEEHGASERKRDVTDLTAEGKRFLEASLWAKALEKANEALAIDPRNIEGLAIRNQAESHMGPFFVQVLATKEPEVADSLVKRLKEAGGFTGPEISAVPGKAGLFRVRTGPYGDRAGAAAVVRRLKAEKWEVEPSIVRADRQTMEAKEPPQQLATVRPSAALPARKEELSLTMTFREDCWAEVSADGQPMAAELFRKGVVKEFSATEKFVITLGNAGAVSLSLNGSPVPLDGARGVSNIVLDRSGARYR